MKREEEIYAVRVTSEIEPWIWNVLSSSGSWGSQFGPVSVVPPFRAHHKEPDPAREARA